VTPPCILVVDDDGLCRALVRSIARREGWEAVFAHEAWEAVATFDSRRWDAVVVNLTLPGRHGTELVRRIRSTDVVTPIVVMAGSMSGHSLMDAMRRGVSGYLSKPLERTEVTRLLTDIFTT